MFAPDKKTVLCACGEKAICIMTLGDDKKPLCDDCKNYWQAISDNKPGKPEFEDL